jgi:predicted nucleic acid-binding protein
MQRVEQSKPVDESSKLDMILKLVMENNTALMENNTALMENNTALMEQKTVLMAQKIEIEQLKKQQVQLSHSQSNANVSSCSLKDGIDFSEFDSMILDAKRGLMAASTSNAWRKK